MNRLHEKDYYPFGMLMPGRNDNVGKYRFGFNGKENDNEVQRVGNWQDYGERVYSPRLGRFPSPDPLIIKYQKFSWYSPYQFAGNKVIWKIDLEGLQEGAAPKPGNEPTLKYPSSEVLKQTFGPEAKSKVYDAINDPNFVENNEITPDQQGLQNFANSIGGTLINETHQEERPIYSGKLTKVASQLADEKLVTPENPDGRVPGTWNQFTTEEQYIPENTGSTLNPGLDGVGKLNLGEGKAILYVIEVVVVEPN